MKFSKVMRNMNYTLQSVKQVVEYFGYMGVKLRSFDEHNDWIQSNMTFKLKGL